MKKYIFFLLLIILSNSASAQYKLFGWGSNAVGQLNQPHPFTPHKVTNSNDWQEICQRYSGKPIIALKTDGSLWTWGRGVLAPKHIDTAYMWNNWKSVAACGSHILAIKTDGSLWSWGENYKGQMGNGIYGFYAGSYEFPQSYSMYKDWQAVAVAWGYSVALKTDGTLWSWGNNHRGQLGYISENDCSPYITRVNNDKDWTSIKCANMTFATKKDGSLWGWGGKDGGYRSTLPKRIGSDNDWELLNDATTSWQGEGILKKKDGSLWITEITNMGDSVKLIPYVGYEQWKTFSTNAIYTLAIHHDGSLWAYGKNTNGQLGDGTQIDRNVPIQIGNDKDWKMVYASDYASFAIKQDGSLWSWGTNKEGMLGLGLTDIVTKAIPIDEESTYSDIYGGYNMFYAIKQDSTINGWGGEQSRLLGNIIANGNNNGSVKLDLKYLAVGDEHTVVLKSDGSLIGWGNNHFGQINDSVYAPDENYIDTATEVSKDKDWEMIACGMGSTYAVKNDGSLWNRGIDSLDNINLIFSKAFKQIGDDKDWKTVSVGKLHSAAIKTNGSLWVRGLNWFQAIGMEPNYNQEKYYQVGIDNDWIDVVCGGYFTIALKANGTIWGWGLGLGVCDTNNYYGSAFHQIGEANNWASISADCIGEAALGIKKDGTLWAWGSNNAYQLGTGTNVVGANPIKVGNEDNWFKVKMNNESAMGLQYQMKLLKTNLIYPDNNSEMVPINPTFKWLPIGANNYYYLQIAEDKSFEELVFEGNCQNNSALVNLDKNKKYFWRIRTKSKQDVSPWSDIWEFYTGINANVKEHLLNANQVQIYPQPATDEINIRIEDANISNMEVQIYDLAGHQILSTTASKQLNNVFKIDVKNLLHGSYYLILKAENTMFRTAIIK